MWLSSQGPRFNEAVAQWHALVSLHPLKPDAYLYWASMLLMPSNPSTGGFNLAPAGLKMVADNLLMAARRILPHKDQWSLGTLIDIATEDGLEHGAKVIGPSESGDTSERRV
eukprot:COSAG02_NODE_8818_length_2433_cov_1.469152_3_plen_111_part_01